ncbi:MAG: Lrp/AsnC family transcriptional regulator [Syntrophomonadaceae bacterium]|jgi:DNA-binding Lrp family transcriptional regulator
MELKRQILNLIEHEAKLSPKLIATMLGQEETAIVRAIREMEDDKVILGYNTVINWEKMMSDGVTATIEVKVTPQREVGFNGVAERICKFPEVRSVHLMSGSYDLSVVVDGDNLKEIASFVSLKLSTLDEVVSTVTHFVLKTYKVDNFVFEEAHEDERLVISP